MLPIADILASNTSCMPQLAVHEMRRISSFRTVSTVMSYHDGDATLLPCLRTCRRCGSGPSESSRTRVTSVGPSFESLTESCVVSYRKRKIQIVS